MNLVHVRGTWLANAARFLYKKLYNLLTAYKKIYKIMINKIAVKFKEGADHAVQRFRYSRFAY